MTTEKDSIFKCHSCGLTERDFRFENQQGWTYQWLRIAPTLNIGYKLWSCRMCLELELSGFKIKGIERKIKKNDCQR